MKARRDRRHADHTADHPTLMLALLAGPDNRLCRLQAADLPRTTHSIASRHRGPKKMVPGKYLPVNKSGVLRS